MDGDEHIAIASWADVSGIVELVMTKSYILHYLYIGI